MKKYDEWNEIKKKIDAKEKKIVIPKAREVYWASIGENIGNEQNGKGNIFSSFPSSSLGMHTRDGVNNGQK